MVVAELHSVYRRGVAAEGGALRAGHSPSERPYIPNIDLTEVFDTLQM